MKIVVLIKQVPDTWQPRTLARDTGLLERGVGESVLDEINERALEVALLAAATLGATVTALAMGPRSAADAARKALALGADAAVHLSDERLAGADLGRTARALGASITRLGPDVVLAGNRSTDGQSGVLPAMLAQLLGVPHLTHLDHAELTADGVEGVRERRTVRAALPAVVSVTERAAEPRFATFRGIMRAKRKPLESWTLDDIGGLDVLGASAPAVAHEVLPRPERVAGTRFTDDGTASEQILTFLRDRSLL